jgi:hypothetical protein
MDLQNVWTVATKDFGIFTKKKSIMYSVILFPLLVAIGLPMVVHFACLKSGGIPTAYLLILGFWYGVLKIKLRCLVQDSSGSQHASRCRGYYTAREPGSIARNE